jgi:hypothetical protein
MDQIIKLGSTSSLKIIFKTLQNQCSDIFNGSHNANHESITTCLQNLEKLIAPDDEDYIYELFAFIGNGICHIARNYGKTSVVSSIVLNFLMTAIHSYNQISAQKYRFESETCPNTNSLGKAFLMQVLLPHINAGAKHFPPSEKPLTFTVIIQHSPVIRSPSPDVGPRGKPIISFGKAVKRLQRQRRKERGYRSNSSDTEGSDGGGKRKFSKQRRSRQQRRQSKKRLF